MYKNARTLLIISVILQYGLLAIAGLADQASRTRNEIFDPYILLPAAAAIMSYLALSLPASVAIVRQKSSGLSQAIRLLVLIALAFPLVAWLVNDRFGP